MKRVMGILTALVCTILLCACSVGAFEYDTQSSAPIDLSADSVSEAQVTLALSFGERAGMYSGEVAQGLPHGQGTFKSSNTEGISWVYEGGWNKGHMYGEGTTTFETGCVESGWYENDSLNGQGRISQDGRLVYEGAFTDNMPDGQGKLCSYSGAVIFSGSFAEGYIEETPKARSARLEPVKEQCAAADYSTLYESAQNEDGAYVKVTGEVAYVVDTDAAYESNFVIVCQGEASSGYANQVCVCYHLSVGEEPVLAGQTVTI